MKALSSLPIQVQKATSYLPVVEKSAAEALHTARLLYIYTVSDLQFHSQKLNGLMVALTYTTGMEELSEVTCKVGSDIFMEFCQLWTLLQAKLSVNYSH